MTVVEPFDVRLSAEPPELDLRRGATGMLVVKTENVPKDAGIQLMNLPAGVAYRVAGRETEQTTFSLEAAPDAGVGVADISAELKVGKRWAATRPLKLTVLPALVSGREEDRK